MTKKSKPKRKGSKRMRAPRNRETLRGGARRSPLPLGTPVSAAEGRVLRLEARRALTEEKQEMARALAGQLVRLQDIYSGTGAIRKISMRKKLIGTRTEEDLTAICDEIDAEVLVLAESLGFTLDDVISEERE